MFKSWYSWYAWYIEFCPQQLVSVYHGDRIIQVRNNF